MINGITCVCLTYGRIHTLEEAIHCYLMQKVPDVPIELLIVNDCKEQILTCDRNTQINPIRIINMEKRFETLGEKYQYAVSQANYDYIAVWEDDDIFLPHRLKLTVNRIKENDLLYYKMPWAFFMNEPKKINEISTNLFFSSGTWHKDLLNKLGGFSKMNLCDADIERRFEKSDKIMLEKPKDLANIYYMYRWGAVNVYHASGMGIQHDSTALKRAEIDVKRSPYWKTGEIKLDPHWNCDYVYMVEEFLKKGNKNGQI